MLHRLQAVALDDDISWFLGLNVKTQDVIFQNKYD